MGSSMGVRVGTGAGWVDVVVAVGAGDVRVKVTVGVTSVLVCGLQPAKMINNKHSARVIFRMCDIIICSDLIGSKAIVADH